MIDNQDERIATIFSLEGVEDLDEVDDKVLSVDEQTLVVYLKFLKENIEHPFYLTGIQKFIWEKYYVSGPGNKKQYNRMKKIRPSYTDIFHLNGFNEKIDPADGILVDVQRVSDDKEFTLPLLDLEPIEKASINCQRIDDYHTWFVLFF